MHAFLKDPENNRAYAFLSANPIGSLRTWADSLSWSQGKLQRFLKAASKLELALISTSRDGTVFEPFIVGEIGASAEPDARASAESDAPDAPFYSRARAPIGTTTTRLTTTAVQRDLSRNRESVVNREKGDRLKNRLRLKPEERQEGAADLVAAMNEILCRNHPLDYLPVDTEQIGSHRCARKWLRGFGIPLADAIAILTQKAAAFNPGKINGEMPRSLGFFTMAVKAEWRRIQRDREQLKLFQKEELHVEPPAPKVPESAREPAKLPTPAEVIERYRAELERAAADPTSTRERVK